MGQYNWIENSEWKKGDVISSARLNNIENGIRKAYEDMGNLNVTNNTASENYVEGHYITGFDPGKTLSKLEQEHGYVTAEFQSISITSDQISDGNQAGEVVKLNNSGIIPSELLPSYVDDIIEYATINDFPSSSTDSTPDDGHNPSGPETGKIYVDISTGRTYRWSGSQYTEVGVAHLDYTDSNAANTDYVKQVTQTKGQIDVVHAAFNPSLTITPGTTSAAPKIKTTIANNPSADISLTIATEGITGVYGVTKLSNTAGTDTTVAATPKGVQNAISELDVSDTAITGEFVSQVSETDGKISVIRTALDPSITINAGTADNAPTINVTVNSKSGSTAQPLTKASTSVYGVTKLITDTTNSANLANESLAVTTKGLWNAINTLNDTVTAGNGYIDSITQTNGKITGTTAAFPEASTTTKGMVQVGDNLTINNNGILSATNTTYAAATTTEAGLMSGSDKNKLDTIDTNLTNLLSHIHFNDGKITGIDVWDSTGTSYKTLSFDNLPEEQGE